MKTMTKRKRPKSGWAKRVREARLLNGLTQQEFADALGITRRALVEWEYGQVPTPSHQKLIELFEQHPEFFLK